jgi:tRNA pseudouridine55 synthase
MNGVVLIDKPSGCTSHDVVNRWRRIAGTKRAGHLGTLDPLATGLLVLVTGSATRLAPFYEKEEKTYVAEIEFGAVSNTYDSDGDVLPTGATLPENPHVLLAALTEYQGTFQQVPPPVSAKKIGGVRAYKLARQNLEVVLKPVPVTISELEVLGYEPPRLILKVTCSAGTYIRSLAHNLGERLGCGALLDKLRRTRVGCFDVKNAYELDKLQTYAADGRLNEAVIPSGSLLPQIPAQFVDDVTEMQIRQGRDFRTSPFVVSPGAPRVKALSRTGELIAIGELRIPNVYHPSTVF